jgi:hypothetical protein
VRRFAGLALAALLLAGCGPGIPVPLPVAPTPTPPAAGVVAPPPPTEVLETSEEGGLCGQSGLESVARFIGHYNADDGGHYHGWLGPTGETFWVRC